ncbi:MAG: hypothetical protein FWB80_09115 [Defluviitaleaceae bacterium]|nr:hypothetical protein [Defluviitaleaceae bacterium]
MSNMVVRTNVFALNAHRNLTNVGLSQRKSAQRLSSGFRINSAVDDAAGLAISESMRAQIRGLDQASINAQDAVGLIQTAEGAMATVSDMVIRIRELLVQASNDTYTFAQRGMIQVEIDQLMQEINDVTFRTEFNTRTLLAGGLTGGGGHTSPVSLQWMLFQQARVIGLPRPNGTVGPNGLHPNPNNKNETSLRHSIIELQTELNDLARRVGDRLVATGDISRTQLSNIFATVPYDFTVLAPHMATSETQQMRNIQNRVDSYLRTALRTAEEIYQITQDQIRALGGASATNNDGSNVFIQKALAEWNDAANGARETLNAIRTAIIGTGTLSAPGGYLGELASISDIESLNRFIINLVGVPSDAISPIGVPPTATPPIPPVGIPPSATGDRIIDFNALSGTQSGDGWNFTGGVLTITGNGDFQINGTGATTANRIVVQSGTTANIMLNNSNISAADGAALDMRGARVNLWLAGSSTNSMVTTSENNSGIQTTGGIITINGTGTLTASNSSVHIPTGSLQGRGAGIGGGDGEDGGTIIINGGRIYAHTSVNGAGIGGGRNGDGGNIFIAGGYVTVPPYNTSAAGIGGGSNGNGGTITISGGTVNTTSWMGAALGSGGDTTQAGIVDGGDITIIGGTIIATGFYGAGIGGGFFANGGNLVVSGGNVTANTRGVGAGAAIGGGGWGNGGTVLISGGIVVASNDGSGSAIGGGFTSALFPDTGNGGRLTIAGGVLEIISGAIGGGTGSSNHGTTSYINGNLPPTIAQILSGVVDRGGRPLEQFQVPLDPTWGYQPGDSFNRTVTIDVNGVEVSFAVNAIIDSNGELFIWLNESSGRGLLCDIECLLRLALGALGTVNLEANGMWFQLGANAMQGMFLQLKGIHTGILGGGRGDLAMLIDVREKNGIPISKQLDIIDIAEGIVNAQRAQLGAVQNRLEFTRQSVDISSENLTAAESRIRDTDMAREMMRFTAAQVLQQAGISMLAQANQLPANILQLLQ